jgi:cytochrome c peroxidase
MPFDRRKVKARSWRFRTPGPVRLLTFRAAAALLIVTPIVAVVLAACQPARRDPQAELIEKGRQIFFNETFGGNGRTCGTCHREEDNFTITPAFIATLPKNDPLFVAEFIPALAKNFENPKLMREFGLILENLDGFDDLDNKFVMRGVPHVLSLATSIDSPRGPHLGWSGDGAPGDGSLRSFATGAVIQHFTKTLNRIPGVDFRLPTDQELDALEAFQRSLGRSAELNLPLALKGTVARRGQELFLDDEVGKCNLCHRNAGAIAVIADSALGNANFNTGVEDLPDQPARLTMERVPRDDGSGNPGDSTFNVPPLVESADTGPFFHNNSIQTLEGAVGFYDGDSFNNSPAGRTLAALDPEHTSIELDGTQIGAIAAFLRVINALDNIRQATEALEGVRGLGFFDRERGRVLLDRAAHQTEDASAVLSGAGLHPDAVIQLAEARRLIDRAHASIFNRRGRVRQALAAEARARDLMVEASP